MGSGASSIDIEEHLKKWESAIDDLHNLCTQNRAALSGAAVGVSNNNNTGHNTNRAISAGSSGDSPHTSLSNSMNQPLSVVTPTDPNEATINASGGKNRVNINEMSNPANNVDSNTLRGRRLSSLVSFGGSGNNNSRLLDGSSGSNSTSNVGGVSSGAVSAIDNNSSSIIINSEGGGGEGGLKRRNSGVRLTQDTGSASFNVRGIGVAGTTTVVASPMVNGGLNNESTWGSCNLGSEYSRTPKIKRQHLIEIHKARNALFKSYVSDLTTPVKAKIACDHFATVAIALSALLGGANSCPDRKKKVTVEDIFFAAHVPLHLLHNESIQLTELFDIVHEFIDVDNRFKEGFQVEIFHFDVAPVLGQVELGMNEVGDRQPKMQLPEFRKFVQQILDGEEAIIVVNYDPFVLEQEMTVEADEDEEEDEEEAAAKISRRQKKNSLIDSIRDDSKSPFFVPQPTLSDNLYSSLMNVQRASSADGVKKARYSRDNKGMYAAVVDYRNAVQLMVTLATGTLTDRLNGDFEEVPFSSLFKAIMTHAVGSRARGFLLLTKKAGASSSSSAATAGTAANALPELSSVAIPELSPLNNFSTHYFFGPELASGKVVGSMSEGTHAHTLQPLLSPHIVAFSWGLHLINGASVNTHSHGRGLPVGDIIRTLHLAGDVFLNFDMSLERVYLYADEYLRRKKLTDKFTISLYPVLTSTSKENAVPSISVFDFEGVLLEVQEANDDPEAPSQIMIMQYNANVAHNVLGISTMSQWCILCGYCTETQTATLIDATAQKFCATWTCTLDRLHKAITSYGYMILSRNSSSSSQKQEGSLRSKSSSSESIATFSPEGKYSNLSGRALPAIVQARINVVKNSKYQDMQEVLPRSFYSPPEPFGITIIALALTRLGIERATFDDLIEVLPFHPNTLIDQNFGLEAFLVCLKNYLRRIELLNLLSIDVRHFDKVTKEDGSMNYVVTTEEFESVVREALGLGPENATLIVHYDSNQIPFLGGNDKPFGGFGIILSLVDGTAEGNEGVMVTVADCNPNRFLRTWQVQLNTLYRAIAQVKHVGRRSRGYVLIKKLAVPEDEHRPPSFRDFRLDIVPLQQTFLISPSAHVQGLSIAFAQLGHFYSPEEIFYEAYLKTVNDQRRRGSQAFAWRDVDVSLAILNKKIDTRLMTAMAKKFIESRKVVNLTVDQLEDLDITDLPELLMEASEPSSNYVLLLSYDAATVHGLENMGSSVALVQGYDQERDEVYMFECEYCLFGLEWKCDFAKLVLAADLENMGTSKYGFLKIQRKTAEKRTGFSYADHSNSPINTSKSNKEAGKVTKFVEK